MRNNFSRTRTLSKLILHWPNELCWLEYSLLKKPLGNSSAPWYQKQQQRWLTCFMHRLVWSPSCQIISKIDSLHLEIMTDSMHTDIDLKPLQGWTFWKWLITDKALICFARAHLSQPIPKGGKLGDYGHTGLMYNIQTGWFFWLVLLLALKSLSLSQYYLK